MTTVSVSLPDEMKAFIDAQVVEHGYTSADEYLRDVIRDDQRRKARQALNAKLDEGLKGPFTPMTREDWDELKRKALERLDGEAIRP